MSGARFITLEGGEGVGKSTQGSKLADAIRTRGHDVIFTREPGGTPGAEAIRALVLRGSQDRWSARTEALLFAAARADHVERVITPALDANWWVVCDRFLDSTRAYQGGADGLSDNDIVELHRIGCAGLMPDRTLLLTLPPEIGGERARARDKGREDRFGARDAGYHERLSVAFESLAVTEPDRIRRVDARGDERVVTERMIAAIEDLL